MMRSALLFSGIMAIALSACGSDPAPPQYGANPELPEPRRGLLPRMQIATLAIRPDYSLGSHVAALGLAFSNPAMGERFADGVFVGEHGSWNRSVPVGYKVVFVPFRDGRPTGDPIDFVSGFLRDDGKARGRPVGVTVDPRGALIVADDLSNTVWRITPNESQPNAESISGTDQSARIR